MIQNLQYDLYYHQKSVDGWKGKKIDQVIRKLTTQSNKILILDE